MKRLAVLIVVLLAAVLPALPAHAWEHCGTDKAESDCTTTTTKTTTTTHVSTTTAPKVTTTTECTQPRGCCLAECEGPPTTKTATGPPKTATTGVVTNLPAQLPRTGSSSSTGPLAVIGVALVLAGAGMVVRKPQRS